MCLFQRLNQMAIIAPFDLSYSFWRNSVIKLFAKTRTNYTPRKLKLSAVCNFKERINQMAEIAPFDLT